MKEMSKKGQLTAFIIIGMVIVLAVGYVIYSMQKEAPEEIAPTAAPKVKTFVQSCFYKIAEEAVYIMTLQGGYTKPASGVDYLAFKASHVYLDGAILSPTLNTMQTDLSRYIEENLNNCLQDFKSFKDLGYTVVSGKPEVETAIKEKTAFFSLHYPISIVVGGKTEKIESFSTQQESRLFRINQIQNQIVLDIAAEPEFINIKNLDIFDEVITMSPTGTSIVFNIQDDSPDYPYVSFFAVRINETLPPKNNPPVFINLQGLKAKVGEPFAFKVEAVDLENDSFIFSSLTSLFEIDENTGVISFMPEDFEAGEYDIALSVTDEKEAVETKFIKVMVSE